jgi:translation initiation factor 3 subunit H
MDVDGELQITNSFPFPSTDAPASDDKGSSGDGAAAAPRAKANTHYQTEMVRCLREMNVDANSVGWYQSASLGNFVGTLQQWWILDGKLTSRNSSIPTSSRTSSSTSPR